MVMVVVGRWMKISTTLTTEHHILVVTAIQPACTLQACSRSPYMLGEFWIFVVACCTPDCGWCRLSVFHMTGRSKCHVLWILVQRIFNDFLVLLFFCQKPAERLLYTDNAIFMTIHPGQAHYIKNVACHMGGWRLCDLNAKHMLWSNSWEHGWW